MGAATALLHGPRDPSVAAMARALTPERAARPPGRPRRPPGAMLATRLLAECRPDGNLLHLRSTSWPHEARLVWPCPVQNESDALSLRLQAAQDECTRWPCRSESSQLIANSPNLRPAHHKLEISWGSRISLTFGASCQTAVFSTFSLVPDLGRAFASRNNISHLEANARSEK